MVATCETVFLNSILTCNLLVSVELFKKSTLHLSYFGSILLHSSPLVLFNNLFTVVFGFSHISHRSFTNRLRLFLGPFLTKYHAKVLFDMARMSLQSYFLSHKVFEISPQNWELRCPTVLKVSQGICSEETLHFSMKAALSDKTIFKISSIRQGASGLALANQVLGLTTIEMGN